MHRQIRETLRQKLRSQGVDLYVACTPANVHYCSGYQSAFLDLSWQMTGTDMVIVPSASDRPPALIVSEYSEPAARAQSDIEDIRTYSLWTECRDFATVSGNGPAGANRLVERPEQYRPREIFGLLRSVLRERGLEGGSIGSDFSLMKHATYCGFRDSFPDNRLIECEATLYAARMLKHPGEIERLKSAAQLFDAGVARAAEAIEPGARLRDLRDRFRAGAIEAANRQPEVGEVQNHFFFAHFGTGSSTTVCDGDIVKLDCGVKLDGYWSDGCRTFCVGRPSATQVLIYDALRAGYEAALERIQPGIAMREVYETAMAAVRAHGLPNYSRGHVGHSIGMDDQTEEPPFIGPNDAILQPSMVICLELPYYPPDVGGFNIEDMILVTQSGHEVLTRLPRELATAPSAGKFCE